MMDNFRNLAMSLPKRALRNGALILGAALCISGFCVSANASATYTTIDVPGSTYTEALSINSKGAIAGHYHVGIHDGGFVRAPDGTITTIDVPESYSTEALSINDKGVIAGWTETDCDTARRPLCIINRGFVRAADGTFTSFDADLGGETYPTSINGKGVIAGYCGDYPYHSFVRAADGTITTFDPKGSTYTYAASINDKGVIVGTYRDSTGRDRGFVRHANGTIKAFDVAGSRYAGATSINATGSITGWYGSRRRGFVRAPDGSITTFDVGSLDDTSVSRTNAVSINSTGAIAGSYYDYVNRHDYGFVRAPDGSITTFDVPGSRGTDALSINATGAIAGYYYDVNGEHGFLRTP